ncbi:hypothetical protein MLD38_039700 [Melastoma candidum]|uniref:Uncharacterized protein n=1 Tax=Melastoma candidum TaxID=119954 RepID=A0ACB9L2W4_9MYRT|nr:hypothetical protein MLD38_039700 [Melastoma candidum]
MQRAGLGCADSSSAAVPDQIEDGMVDEFKRKQKDDEIEVRGNWKRNTDKNDERAHKLAHGRNHSDRKEKDSTRCSSERKRS